MVDLGEKSIKLLLDRQGSSGAFPIIQKADSPIWLNETAMICQALDLADHSKYSRKGLIWALETLEKNYTEISPNLPDAFFSSAFTDDQQSYDTIDQLCSVDGVCHILLSLTYHIKNSRAPFLYDQFASIIFTLVDFILSLRNEPCYPIWLPSTRIETEFVNDDEFEAIYLTNQGIILAILQSLPRMFHLKDMKEIIRELQKSISSAAVKRKYFRSYYNNGQWSGIDSYVFKLHTLGTLPRSRQLDNTKDKIVELLQKNTGLQRYRTDQFFGGGNWSIPSLHYANYLFSIGKKSDCSDIFSWIEEIAGRKQEIPMFIPNTKSTGFDIQWKNRISEIPQPHLHSHAVLFLLGDRCCIF